MAAPLIRTKLRLPFTRSKLVPRPRLQEQIMQGLRGPLTLITAPAGFGKTTLIASCIADHESQAAWLSLDKDDNQEGRFLRYLIAALSEADQEIGGEASQLMMASQQVPPEMLLTSLVNDLDATGSEIVLVLDDYHTISSRGVHSAVTFLLDHCPTTFHLAIASRSDPPLPLARLRARGQTVELRAADLSFTEAEAAKFLNEIMGLHLDAGSIAVLEERTEGWIVGLQMAALSIRDRDDVIGFIEGFSGTNRHILDYLLEEVLARETEEVQAFLFQTSILTRLSGPLCDAVTGISGGQAMLERLESRNLFVIPLDDDRRWYRYHHLFADLLQARLHRSEPDLITKLLSRAAGWCEQNDLVAESVGYALAAKDYDMAAGLILKYWASTTTNGEIEAVWSWLNALPEETIRNSAPLGVTYCWMLWLRGQVDLIEGHLEDAERAVSESDYEGLGAELSALRAFVARYHGEYETAIDLAGQALALTPDASSPDADPALLSMIYLALASAYDGAGDLEKSVDAYTEVINLSRAGASPAGVTGITYRLAGVLRVLGRLREADRACRDALEYIEEQGMGRLPAAGILHLAMSEVLVEQNDLESAQEHLEQGIELGKWSGRLDAARNAVHALVRLKLAYQDVAGALAATNEAERALGEPPSPLARAEVLSIRVRALIAQGDLTGAAKCADESMRLAGEERGQTGQMAALAALRVLIAQGRFGEAVERLTRSIVDAEDRGQAGAVIEMLVLRSLSLAQQGDTPAAMADLDQALALAEPGGYVRVFLDEGSPVQMLIARWLAHAGDSPLRDYAVDLLSQFEAEQRTISAAQAESIPDGGLIEPLSEREMEVLHIMALGRTNQEIAEQLVVARGTIKAHTASIYRKLDVANRTEAVARARELGILP
ncbi:MAG: helix-turn-helix transcriptional regulator [Anaerolineae bacterium]|nr:helix-turn-helix transcriptional regulator [Anaerolineae bacterium]